MKKIIAFIVGITIGLVIYLALGNVDNVVNAIIENNEIVQDRPTDSQIEQFETKKETKCFYYYLCKLHSSCSVKLFMAVSFCSLSNIFIVNSCFLL